jgi:hypothetical protein
VPSSGQWVQLTFRMTRPLKHPLRVALTDVERDSIRRRVNPAECRLPFLSPAESLRPDLRLIHVNCPVATFEASVSSRRPPGDGQAQDAPWMQRRGKTSRHNVCCQYWSEALRRNIEALRLGHSWQRASSLRLAMGLTTILTTIWVCPPNLPQCRILIYQGNRTSVDALGRAADVWGSRGREFKSYDMRPPSIC